MVEISKQERGMKAPSFWYQHAGLIATLLSPLSLIYRAGGAVRRAVTSPYRAKIPVICIGNIVAGGAGKTPTALALAQMLQQNGAKPVFVTRGYGGSESGPLQVDPARQTAHEVGDEALLLARAAPTWVGRDRAAAIHAAETHGTHIIMDDGLQNPSVQPDISFLVIDGETGLGNGCLIPAGPLRETLDEALKRVAAIIVITPYPSNVMPAKAGIPFGLKENGTPAYARVTKVQIVHAHLQPDLPKNFPKAQKFFAFAGIGRPEKFYRTCREAGLTLTGTHDFPDHHFFNAQDLNDLQLRAATQGAQLLTTEKDWVRLPDNMRSVITSFPVKLVFDDPEAMQRLLK